MALLQDGFKLLITFPGSGVTFHEVSGKPGGFDGGDKIDLSTMRNTLLKTYASQTLVDTTDATLRVAYDSALIGSIQSQINVNQEIVFTLPDESTVTFWGFLKIFEPGDFTMGERPEADIVFSPTNLNDADPPVETAPVVA